MIDSVKILGLTYKIKEVEVVRKDEYRFGEIDFEAQEIRIDKSFPEDRKTQVLIHEILHGICDSLGLEDLTSDEQVIQSLASALYQVFSETPISFS